VAKADKEELEEKSKILGADLVRVMTAFRYSEKFIEDQQQTIDNLEKIRDNYVKNVAENNQTVSSSGGLCVHEPVHSSVHSSRSPYIQTYLWRCRQS